MPEPIRCLRGVFADKICRGVAAIAGGNCAVRRLEPAVELFTHDVAVGAGCRVVTEIGPTLGIGKSINADANGNPDNHSKQDTLDHARFHLCFPSPTIARSCASEEWMEFGSIRVLGLKRITQSLHYPELCIFSQVMVRERFELLEPLERLELFYGCQPPPRVR